MQYRHARKLILAALGVVAVTGAVAMYGGAANSSSASKPAPSTPRTALGIPTSGTVIMLEGALGSERDVRRSFGGQFDKAPYTKLVVSYPASLSKSSLPTGIERLDSAIKKTKGPKIVLAHGQGAQVASRWLRLHASDSTAPAAQDLTFLFTGNPLRVSGGAIIGQKEVDGAIGAPTPTDTKWPVIDVTRRYDGWSDAPNNPRNKEAADEAELGAKRFHDDYSKVDLSSSTNTVWKQGSTTLVLTQEQLPSWNSRDNVQSSDYVLLRQRVEAGYTRPKEDAGKYNPGCAPGVDPAAQAGKRMPGTPLPIPASATVLTLSGLNFNLYHDMPEKFQGVFAKDPYCIIEINYPASISKDSIVTGVANLNAMLKLIPGPKIVMGQSQGAQVSSRWMREFGNDPRAPKASELTFLLTGNPLRSAGGGDAIGKKEVDKVIGQPTPTTTKWPIVDVSRRYEGWADYPNDRTNALAVANAEAGKKLFHKAYDVVDIKDPSHTIWKNGNTTYVLTREDVLPLYVGKANIPADIQAMMRGRIDAAYERSSNDPKAADPGTISSATLEGLLMPQGFTATQMNGMACAAPLVCTKINYKNVGSRESINDGVTKLDAWIRNTPGKKIVFGYSLGATVAQAWMRTYGKESTAPPAGDLRFVLTGNPERAGSTELATNPKYGGIPADVKYQVSDICRRKDSVCDPIPSGKKASLSVHLAYGDVDPFSPENVVTQTGNIQSILIP